MLSNMINTNNNIQKYVDYKYTVLILQTINFKNVRLYVFMIREKHFQASVSYHALVIKLVDNFAII